MVLEETHWGGVVSEAGVLFPWSPFMDSGRWVHRLKLLDMHSEAEENTHTHTHTLHCVPALETLPRR